jgi:two-component system LytT family sensor kinase
MLWLGIWAVWTVLALMSAGQAMLVLSMHGAPFVWWLLIARSLADWYTCAMFTPLFFWLARRYPIARGTWKKSLLIHFPIGIAAVVVKYSVFVPIEHALIQLAGDFAPRAVRLNDSITTALASNILLESMFIWATIGAVHGIEFYRRYRDRESAAHRLAAELSRAQLDALRAQLHPHFLFNTLNAIATLIHTDPDAADSMITRLADLMRAALQYTSGRDCTLAEELMLARTYVEIMQRRFAERVTVDWVVPASLAAARVPAFLLQPLLENAFEHGASSDRIATSVAVRAERSGDVLQVTVSDDGAGLPDDAALDEGVGLSNTRQRLAALYGAAASLVVGPAPASRGTMVTATLPFVSV